ncbi:MAG: hypothetical protein FJ216_07285 [Ignavibacteria bacterium]|nr:hypothetical protein [Ignavibacteria bacterium]
MKKYLPLLFIFLLFLNSCKDPVSENVLHLPPETYLTVIGDSITPSSTIKKISWWGDSPQGFVVGFNISFDSLNWGFTTQNDSTFIFTIQGSDSTFRIWVAAVDNQGYVDPTPASNSYPVLNSPPDMQFVIGTEIPDTIFPVATFKWVASDPDGLSTISNFYWALNDTNNWRMISGNLDIMTLTKDSGLVINSDNCLFMKVRDNAGAFSAVRRMPSDTAKFFYVRPVTSKVLLIKDIPAIDNIRFNSYFSYAMDTVNYDVLDIKSNNGSLIPKIVNPMFIETMKLFNVVIWSANRGNVTADNANFELAQNSLPFYLLYGKVFFTSGFPNVETQTQGNLLNFAPVDSITYCTIPFVSQGTQLINIDNAYPQISVSSDAGIGLQRVRGLQIPPTTKIIYRLPINTACQDSMIVGIKDLQINPRIILFGLPVYFLNGNPEYSKLLMRKILIEEFNLNK